MMIPLEEMAADFAFSGLYGLWSLVFGLCTLIRCQLATAPAFMITHFEQAEAMNSTTVGFSALTSISTGRSAGVRELNESKYPSSGRLTSLQCKALIVSGYRLILLISL